MSLLRTNMSISAMQSLWHLHNWLHTIDVDISPENVAAAHAQNDWALELQRYFWITGLQSIRIAEVFLCMHRHCMKDSFRADRSTSIKVESVVQVPLATIVDIDTLALSSGNDQSNYCWHVNVSTNIYIRGKKLFTLQPQILLGPTFSPLLKH